MLKIFDRLIKIHRVIDSFESKKNKNKEETTDDKEIEEDSFITDLSMEKEEESF